MQHDFPGFLLTPVMHLPWVGVATAKKLARLNIITVLDLLKHKPSGILQRRFIPDVSDAVPGEMVVTPVKILEHLAPPFMNKRTSRVQPYIIDAVNRERPVRLVFFNTGARGYLPRAFKPDSLVYVAGKLEFFHGIPSFSHPEIITQTPGAQELIIDPVYPLTAGIHLASLRNLILRALGGCPSLPEWISPTTLKLFESFSWRDAILKLHNPLNEQDLALHQPHYQRLVFDELLANQLALLATRCAHKKRRGQRLPPGQVLREMFQQILPFRLTDDQQRVIHEIDKDLSSDEPMMRLLQGDVGSGKTVVAMMALLNAIENGKQAALMAPTEILARQHACTIVEWAKSLGIQAAVLTGRDKGKARAGILDGLRNGTLQLIIGTHALIQEDVIFQKLGLAVIDEQHRFGVEQRLKLVEKGNGVNVLSMTATPIPRTLMLSHYGDLDCSYLREKPALRKEIDTRTCSLDKLEEFLEAIKRACAQDHKVFWVCPLVEESESLDLAAATDRYESLKQLFPADVGLVHGRMKENDKSQTMEKFRTGQLRILVATTVIEVGVDVPDATIMVIEHAERFGLAQLHQLRGRVGRGSRPGICMLLYNPTLNPVARARLNTLRHSNDGFRIAEEDLRLRGAGDLAGLKQSGLPPFVFADLMVHQELVKLAMQEAQAFMKEDPLFRSERSKALKTLLHLFQRQESLRFLSAV